MQVLRIVAISTHQKRIINYFCKLFVIELIIIIIIFHYKNIINTQIMKQLIDKRQNFRNSFRQSANRQFFYKQRIKLQQLYMEQEFQIIQVPQLKILINSIVINISLPSFDDLYKILNGIKILNDQSIMDQYFIEFVIRIVMFTICHQSSQNLSNNLIISITSQILKRMIIVGQYRLISRYIDMFLVICRDQKYFCLLQMISHFDCWEDKHIKQEFIKIFIEQINKKIIFECKQIDIIANFSREPDVVDFEINKLLLNKLQYLLKNRKYLSLQNEIINKIFECIIQLSWNKQQNEYIASELSILSQILDIFQNTSEIQIKINFLKIIRQLSQTIKTKQNILTQKLLLLLKKIFDQNNQYVIQHLVLTLNSISQSQLAVKLFIIYQIYQRLQYKAFSQTHNTRLRSISLYSLINLLWFANQYQFNFLIERGFDSVIYEALASEDQKLIKYTLKLIKQCFKMKNNDQITNEAINFDFFFKKLWKDRSIAFILYELADDQVPIIASESKKIFCKYFKPKIESSANLSD